MKIKILAIILILLQSTTALSQCPDAVNFNLYKAEISRRISADFFNYNKIRKLKYYQEKRDSLTAQLASKISHKDSMANSKEIINLNAKIKAADTAVYNFQGKDIKMVEILFCLENENESHSYTQLDGITNKLIQGIDDINILQLLLSDVREMRISDASQIVIQNKLIKNISIQMNLLAGKELVWYNFLTNYRKPVKGICISTSNDLFTPTGLLSEIFTFNTGKVFQRNDDRDYTGGVLLEITTDYLRINRRRALKTYQRLIFGADVFTPYFRDTVVFSSDTSFNKKDKPHASFQYFGWGTSGISWNYLFRWDIAIKAGRIGGNRGAALQSALHQDISYSPRPQGWGAQIANSGRIGFSAEYKPEWLIQKLSTHGARDIVSRPALFTFLTGDISFGTYMTFVGVGVTLSNKNFLQSNQHNMVLRTANKSATGGKIPFLLVTLKSSVRYVVHNTMLEGYGLIKTSEEKNDAYTPKSVYYLKSNQIKRIVGTIDLIIAKQTKYATLMYRMSTISPETNLGKIGIFRDGKELDISGRWHRWATLGVCFNIQ